MQLARKPLRTPISIQGEHANVRELSGKQKRKLGFKQPGSIIERKALLRVLGNWPRPNLKAYSAALSLAHLLFPKNFPELLATDLKNESSYSLKARLSKASGKGIADYYRGGGRRYALHSARVRGPQVNRLADFLHNAGIGVNENEMNVGFTRKSQPVFFEVSFIDIQKLEKVVSSLPEANAAQQLRKRQALELFGFLKKEARGRTVIQTHVGDEDAFGNR